MTASLSDRNDPALIRAAQAGDIEARNRLIVANMGLVYKAVRDEVKKNPEDFISDGVECFIGVIKRFDPSKGFALSTFAIRSIRLYIRRVSVVNGGVIKLPPLDRGDVGKKRLEQGQRARNVRSLDAERRDGRSLLEVLSQRGSQRAEVSHRLSRLRHLLPHLDEEHRQIISERLRGRSLRSIGNELGKSPERIRQLQLEGIKTLRALMAAA